MMAEDFRIQEVLDAVNKYYWNGEAFDDFKNQTFLRYSPDERAAVLMGWDRMMEQETKPSRATASLISMKRELDDLHSLLCKANR
jgi:hypothetical protein